MEKLTINVPTGHEIDLEKSDLSKGEIVFKTLEKKLPEKWEDLGVINGYWINSDSKICGVVKVIAGNACRDIWPSKELAEASLALAQLLQLRKAYVGDWEPDWKHGDRDYKYVIEVDNDELKKESYLGLRRIMSFPTPELRDKFLTNFLYLLETAKPLL